MNVPEKSNLEWILYFFFWFLQDNKELFGDIIVNQDGFIYIAGNAKQMPDQVQDAFKEAIFSLDESDRKGAEKFVKTMLEEKRLQMETWSWKRCTCHTSSAHC